MAPGSIPVFDSTKKIYYYGTFYHPIKDEKLMFLLLTRCVCSVLMVYFHSFHFNLTTKRHLQVLKNPRKKKSPLMQTKVETNYRDLI